MQSAMTRRRLAIVGFGQLGAARAGVHENILFEARFAVPAFAARVMLDAAARLAYLRPGVHRYALWADAGGHAAAAPGRGEAKKGR